MEMSFDAGTLRAQAPKPNWESKAEARFKSIYERGDFRAKNDRRTWLSDSTGFVTQDSTSSTKNQPATFYDVRTGDSRPWGSDEQLPSAGDPRLSPDGLYRLASRGANLVSVNKEDGKETTLISSPPGRTVEYRNPSWSPNGAHVLYVEADMTDVRQRSVLVPSDPSYPDVQQHRFARVAEKIEALRVGVVKADGSIPTWLPIPFEKEGGYLGQVAWAGNSEEILVERFSRFRNRRDFILVHLNGTSQTIFSEANDAWVESSQGKNSGLIWTQGGEKFVVITEKDGWRHAFLYSRDGKELAKLTQGEFDIIDRSIVDEKRGWFYFYASPSDGTQKYLFRTTLDGSGVMERITPGDQVGTHAYQFSPDARWAIHSYSTLNAPPRHELIEVEGHRVVCLLDESRELRENMQSVTCRPAEFLKVDIGNGVVMDAWMIKPGDFDASKKYPLFIYVYGEPHAQTVLDEWGAAQIDFHRVVAEMGYIVVSMDNRGTPSPKGAAWRRSIFGSLGPLSTEEQEAGLKVLGKQFPFIDLQRVGIWGWSGGGSNTLNALFRKPDSYHVGIAVVPKPQPHLYNPWFQEIFMQTPAVNPEGYARSAPLHFAEGLKGKLLIITGSGETNTHIQIIEGLVDRLIALGKPFDYMVYPNRDHGLREGDGTLVHVRMRVLRYLLENLAPGAK
jgi:dipeptidyl-peptidase-4